MKESNRVVVVEIVEHIIFTLLSMNINLVKLEAKTLQSFMIKLLSLLKSVALLSLMLKVNYSLSRFQVPHPFLSNM